MFATKSLQSCLTLCNPIDSSPSGSPIPGILQARTLEWVAISFSNAWKWKVKGKSLSHVWLFVTPWTAAYQAPPSMGFSRQEYWSGLPLPSLSLTEVAPIDKDWMYFWRLFIWRLACPKFHNFRCRSVLNMHLTQTMILSLFLSVIVDRGMIPSNIYKFNIFEG